ncbi:hypothetical protein XM38_013640 [Halomicronema hongdechloris C2206]|uniref:histidine kinase n=1 Tax=Halomicronema hongdechloris C2206 TaxID=1641165 RepID=A0A1Z3HJG6_9CYAN|nr:PAS domain S-box protein [Halomicronema hongdechloris]ASC70425.1 hypothetical protein XM38_013640 [Halomicronema hongdechloris C2206]
MAVKLPWLSDFLKARLSRRIVLWVFLSIVVIEAIILVPSVYRRERELLQYLQSLSATHALGLLDNLAIDELQGQALLEALRSLQHQDVVLGGALYTANGTLIGEFGEPPELTYTRFQTGQSQHYSRRHNRYDAVWTMSPLEGDYVLIIRHDATWVQQEFFGFVGRIAGLVVIISAFVTGATMIVLERLLIKPIMGLRQDLLKAGQVISQDCDTGQVCFRSLNPDRHDELGDVTMAFEQMFRQITDAIATRKRVEADLRQSEEKFAKAFQASPNPMIISTLADGRLIEVNDTFLHLYGDTSAQVIGQTALELDLWADPQDREDMIDTLRHQGYIRNREYCFQNQQGQLRTVLYSCEQIQINHHPCILSVVNDITERKQAEQALRQSEIRFRTLVEQAADAFFVINSDGRFVDVNQQACDSLGYQRQDLLQRHVWDIEAVMTPERFQQLWQSLQEQNFGTLEGKHRRRDGSQFPVEVRLGLLRLNNHCAVLALARDISERKQGEQALARLAEVGELAAMIVHEVRSPLTTVLMGLQSFQQLELPQRPRLRLQLALEESQRLQRLLNEILMYARQQTLNTTELELNQFLKDMLVTMKELPSCDRTIEFQPTPTAVPITADPDKLKQVFINLLSNACEATSEGDTVRCWITPETNWVKVYVHNGGEPIPPEILPKLTRPFVTTKSSGNGLGLAITHRIIEAHNGTLTIDSSETTGTTVTVSLPATQAHISN